MLISKDFVSMNDVCAEQILSILETAETMKLLLSKNSKKSPHLQGRTAIMFFSSAQSRTKLSFELAAQYLSASVADLSGAKGVYENESIVQVGKTMEQMGADFIIVRHHLAGSAKYLAENVSARVINVGDGNNESPSRSLLDLMTIKMYKGGFDGLKVAIVGDIDNNRLTKSNILALVKLGAKVNACGPPTLIGRNLTSIGVNICNSTIEAVTDADVVMCSNLKDDSYYTKLLPSMNEYKNFFKIDSNILKHAKKDVIVMHPGAIKRGIELSTEVINSKFCVVDEQISNAVAANMALFYLLSLTGGNFS